MAGFSAGAKARAEILHSPNNVALNRQFSFLNYYRNTVILTVTLKRKALTFGVKWSDDFSLCINEWKLCGTRIRAWSGRISTHISTVHLFARRRGSSQRQKKSYPERQRTVNIPTCFRSHQHRGVFQTRFRYNELEAWLSRERKSDSNAIYDRIYETAVWSWRANSRQPDCSQQSGTCVAERRSRIRLAHHQDIGLSHVVAASSVVRGDYRPMRNPYASLTGLRKLRKPASWPHRMHEMRAIAIDDLLK